MSLIRNILNEEPRDPQEYDLEDRIYNLRKTVPMVGSFMYGFPSFFKGKLEVGMESSNDLYTTEHISSMASAVNNEVSKTHQSKFVGIKPRSNHILLFFDISQHIK